MTLPFNPTVPTVFRWTVSDRKPKGGASCSQPFCGMPSKYLLERPGLKQKRNACERCKSLMVDGSLTK